MRTLRATPPSLIGELGAAPTTRWGDVRVFRTTSPFRFPDVRAARAYGVSVDHPQWRGPQVAMVVSYFAIRPNWLETHLVHAHPDFAAPFAQEHPASVEVGRWLYTEGHLTHHAVERSPEHQEWAHHVGGRAPSLDPCESLAEAGEGALDLMELMPPRLPYDQTWRLVQTRAVPAQCEYHFALREGDEDRGKLSLTACATCGAGVILKVAVDGRRRGMGRAILLATRLALPGLPWHTNNQLEGPVPFWQAVAQETGQPYRPMLSTPRCTHGGPERSPLDGWILPTPVTLDEPVPVAG